MMTVLSCRENSFRASLALDGQLSLGGRLVLTLHRMMCAGCRAYARQIRSLTSLLQKHLEQHEGLLGPPGILGQEARQRILRALRDYTRG